MNADGTLAGNRLGAEPMRVRPGSALSLLIRVNLRFHFLPPDVTHAPGRRKDPRPRNGAANANSDSRRALRRTCETRERSANNNLLRETLCRTDYLIGPPQAGSVSNCGAAPGSPPARARHALPLATH